MKTLLLLRHAKSDRDVEGLTDHDRPLNKRGKREALTVGEYLLQCDLIPDLIMTSSAKRARKTAVRVAEACGYSGEISVLPELYDASPEEYLASLHPVSDRADRVMIVGHNPCVQDLVELLAGEECRMVTCAVARIDLDVPSWHALSVQTRGSLISLWRPTRIERPPGSASESSD